jgi:XTP/dITP diphosphohydrolase
MRDLLVATHNLGKMLEFRRLLEPLHARIVFPSELGLHLAVVEDGNTYAHNAGKKASAYASASGLPALADDSGLEVDAINGAPGIRSARYASGEDSDRVHVLLSQLRHIEWGQRTARFRCVIVVKTPTGEQYVADGAVEGLIALAPQGQGGFGYDPVFYLPDFGCTMAQIPVDLKNEISHRARAVQAILPTLRGLFERM